MKFYLSSSEEALSKVGSNAPRAIKEISSLIRSLLCAIFDCDAPVAIKTSQTIK